MEPWAAVVSAVARELGWKLAKEGRQSGMSALREREPVANEEHLAILRQGIGGIAIWNDWRARNPDEKPDLSEANLAGANLYKANLSKAVLSRAVLVASEFVDANLNKADLKEADLSWADLSWTDLSEADLNGVNLHEARLRGADFTLADLRFANLSGANLSGANLREANLSRAILRETIFANIDMRKTSGLGECRHVGPSLIDFRTLSVSENLPISFLRGCGLPNNLIDYLPSLNGEARTYYSCFISYSSKDQVFADRLHADLQSNGVRCWFAPHDLPIDAKTWDAIDEAIRLREKLLLILSKASIASEWVEDEVNKAYSEERARKEIVLFPIRVDNTLMSTAEPWAVKLRDQRNIGDFMHWKKPAEYQRSLERLLRDLKASGEK
jgi:hypothetical protein